MTDTGQWPPMGSVKPKRGNGATRLPEIWPTRRDEVWRVEFDPALGSEIRKTRPAVVVPVTSNAGRQYPGEAVLVVGRRKDKAMTDQIMAADQSRLKNRGRVLPRTDMRSVENAIQIYLALPP